MTFFWISLSAIWNTILLLGLVWNSILLFKIESINMELYSAIGVHIDIRPYRTNKAGNWFLLRLC